MVVALMVNCYSSVRYLRNQKHDSRKYQRYFDNQDDDDEDIEAAIAPVKTDIQMDTREVCKTDIQMDTREV